MTRRLAVLVVGLSTLAACGGGGGGGSAETLAFVHTATVDNVVNNYSYLDHPRLNGHADAIVLAVMRLETGDPYDDNAIGVWYDTGAEQWAIFHQNESPMAEGTRWNVCIPGSRRFVQIATVDNISGNFTAIDHPDLNGNPLARFVATQNWNPGGVGEVYNDRAIGAYYDGFLAQWTIYNENQESMPEGAAFNVWIPPSDDSFAHVSTAGNVSSNYTTISHPTKDSVASAVCQYLHVYAYDGGFAEVYDANFGLWFNGTRWTLFRQILGGFELDQKFFLATP